MVAAVLTGDGALAAAARAVRRVDRAVADIAHLEPAALDRPELDEGPRSAALAPGTAAVGDEVAALHGDGKHHLVDLDGILVAEPGVTDVGDGDPGVRLGRRRTRTEAEEDLVHERRAAARVGARDHTTARRNHAADLGHAVSVAELRDGALHAVGDVVGDIGGGDRA